MKIFVFFVLFIIISPLPLWASKRAKLCAASFTNPKFDMEFKTVKGTLLSEARPRTEDQLKELMVDLYLRMRMTPDDSQSLFFPFAQFVSRELKGQPQMQGWSGFLIQGQGRVLKVFLNPESGEIRYFYGSVVTNPQSAAIMDIVFMDAWQSKLVGKTNSNYTQIKPEGEASVEVLTFSRTDGLFTEVWRTIN